MSCHRPDPAKPAAGISTSQGEGQATGKETAGSAGVTKADADGFPSAEQDEPLATESGRREVVLAGGCFWCTEAVFEKLEGVLDVVSGYAGGTKASAKYDVVSMGGTDHAEAIRIVYDPSKITLGQLLKVFFNIAHDPTQLNRQGADVGRQYRSAVFFADAQQEKIARGYIAQLNQARVFRQPIVTTLEPLEEFFLAEQYHQDFVVRNPNQPYVRGVAASKVEKLQEKYPDKLKP
ncbi:MAG: peptide-methionine (S)-S-oxide reductase MsrA [Phycisphaerales bacterium]|nr:peptide-methionine (S)-S-oxide reductase MsrA [Phycisphaerales bacterium]